MSENALPPVEITGVVYPPGAGGGQDDEETLWSLTFALQPWRRPGGELEELPLWVRQPNLSDEALDVGMELIQPYEIFRLRVVLADVPVDEGYLSAELVEILGKDTSDAELARRAQELQGPVTIQVPFFGTLTLWRTLNWWVKEVEWNGATVTLHLDPDDGENEAELFRLAASLWDDPAGWEQRIRDAAVAELLGLKNDNWLGDDEEELTPEQFRERMTLQSILVFPSGKFEFTYNDGDLFWGHVIQVGGTLSDGPTYAEIAG